MTDQNGVLFNMDDRGWKFNNGAPKRIKTKGQSLVHERRVGCGERLGRE